MNVDVTLVATGEKWVGYHVRSFERVLDELLTGAKSSVLMTVYVISDRAILDQIESALQRGVDFEVFANPEIDSQQAQRMLRKMYNLQTNYENLQIHAMKDCRLHAKVIVIDEEIVLVGSANLSRAAMIDNYELGVLIDDSRIGAKIANLLRELRPR